jgi:hypothetical protein
MLVTTCGWGTAGETPGPGEICTFHQTQLNSGLSGKERDNKKWGAKNKH